MLTWYLIYLLATPNQQWLQPVNLVLSLWIGLILVVVSLILMWFYKPDKGVVPYTPAELEKLKLYHFKLILMFLTGLLILSIGTVFIAVLAGLALPALVYSVRRSAKVILDAWRFFRTGKF